MRFSISNQLHINNHLKAHLGYKSCPKKTAPSASAHLTFQGDFRLLVYDDLLNHISIFSVRGKMLLD